MLNLVLTLKYFLGVLEDVNDRVKAIIIKDGAHHLDLREHNAKDPQSVIEARKKEAALIKSWLQSPIGRDQEFATILEKFIDF